MLGLGPLELVLVIFVILLVFGAKKIPDIAHGIGKGINEFKRALKDESDTDSKNRSVKNERKDQKLSDRPHDTSDGETPEDKT
jgi:sec-independent protein translocase protein TatA